MLVCGSALLLRGEKPRLSTSTPASQHARVVVVEDASATEAYRPIPERVRSMVHQGITNLTGKGDAAAAWSTFVKTQDVVGIKVYSRPGSQVGTRVSVVEGVVEGLLAAHIPSNHIVVWDRRLSDLVRAGFGDLPNRYGVRLAGSVDVGWDASAFYESALLGQLVYGDLEFQQKGESIGRRSFVTKLLTKEITKVINVSPMLNHNSAGVCGNLVSLSLGSVDNTIRFEGEPGKLATAVPEIYALPQVGDRVVLNIVDALICQYFGEQIRHLHYSAALNQVRLSTDPVALDVLSIEEIQKRQAGNYAENILTKTNEFDLYRNAELLELGIAEPKRIDVELVTPAR